MPWSLVAYAFGVALLVAIAFLLTWEPRFEHFHRATGAFGGGPFRLLSYNIYAFNLNPINDLLAYLDRCIDEKGLDCIVLQEVWFPGARARLDAYFRDKGWDVVRQNGLFSSGLYTACRHRVALDNVVTFPWALGTDAMVRKGCLGVQVEGGPKVVNLHLQDSFWDKGTVRRKQLRAAESVFGQALFVGDFNVDARKDAAFFPASMGRLCVPNQTTHVGMDAVFDFCVAPSSSTGVECSADPAMKYSDHYPIFVVTST